MADITESRDLRRRSILGTSAIAVAVISALAFIGLVVGALAGMKGFEEGEDATLVGSVLWVTFSIGAIVALIVGLIAFFVGRGKHRNADRRAGLLAIGWFAVAVLAIVVISLLDS